MVFFNWATMQMAAKIVYYGPGLCGKTTNLSFIYAKTSPKSRGEMVSLETESDRTLFFDLLPIEVGTIGGFKTRLQLYTVPGQVFYNTTRKLVLKGVDGVVFVADSQRPMREANIESFENLRNNLAELGLTVDDIPLVVQYNKRDLKNILTVEELNSDLNQQGDTLFFEATAIDGAGVFETLKEITKLTLKKLRKRMAAPQPSLAPTPRPVRTASPPARRSSISAAALARAAEEAVAETAPTANAAQAPAEAVSSKRHLEVVPAQEVAVEEPAAPHPPTFESAAESDEPVPAHEAPAASPGGPSDSDVTVEEEIPDAGVETTGEPPKEAADAATPTERPEGVEQETPDPEPATHEAEEGADSEEVATVDQVTETPLAAAEATTDEGDVEVAFARTAPEEAEAPPPPLKRVQVSSQMDILAELDSLRKHATMGLSAGARGAGAAEVDLDSLLAAGTEREKEFRRKVDRTINSDVFERMRAVQVAIRIQDSSGDTIHTLEPVALVVDDVSTLEKLSLLFTFNLENSQ